MTFSLSSDPIPSEIAGAVNYLLANFTSNVYANDVSGQVVGPNGEVLSYLYKWIGVKYADSFDGTLNFSNSPTNRVYYGLRNTDDSIEPSAPQDYVWYRVTGGFGTTKFLFYSTKGGRQVKFAVATTKPDDGYKQDTGSAIDLDVITAPAFSAANFSCAAFSAANFS